MLVSGYSHSVRLYDLETGAVVRTYEEIHNDHINISRFSNHSPHLFCSSSFDRTLKLWDLRCKVREGWQMNEREGAPGCYGMLACVWLAASSESCSSLF